MHSILYQVSFQLSYEKKNVLLLNNKCLSIYNFENNGNKIKPKGENIFKNIFN